MKYINYLVLSKFAKGTQNHVNADELRDAIINHDGSEAYYNHFDVLQSGLGIDEGVSTFKGASGPCRPAFNLVGFDFDHEDNPENSLRDVKAFLNYFKFEHFYVAYSGSKGFHISVPFEYFGLEPDENLPKTLRNLAHELKPHFPTLDTSVYNIGRKFRAPNTRHAKTGLYKTILKSDRVDTTSMDAIKEYCKTRHDLMYDVRTYDVEPNAELVKLLEDAKATAAYDKSKVGTALAPTRLEAFDGKVCIKRLFEAEIDEGERNTTCLILINDLFKSGKAIEHCKSVMTPWILRVMPEHRQAECFEMIEDIYRGDRFYNHGCIEPIKSKHCSAKCDLWAKLKPDKRPVPVDAPKQAFKELATISAKPATAFIQDWLKENMVSVTLAGSWFMNSQYDIPIARNIIEDKIFNASDLINRKEYKMVSQNKIVSYLNEYEELEKQRRLKQLNEHLSFTGDTNIIEVYLTAVLSREPTELEIAVLKHWLWLVKRKMHEKSVEREIMLVLAGATNTGKTYALTKIFKPIKELLDTMLLDQINDDRHDFRLVENAVIFFDEMAMTKKVNVDALKNKITAKWINYRPMRRSSRVQGRNLSTFIGSSNNRVADIIKDPTSARRYYEYWVTKKLDWSTINKIDYVEMWRSVDENQDTPYIESFGESLANEQENIRALDSVEEWLEVEELVPTDGKYGLGVEPKQAYENYMEWMLSQRRERYAMSIKRFYSRMKELGLDKRSNNRRFYKILSSSELYNPEKRDSKSDATLGF